MTSSPHVTRVYKSLNKPLLVWGVDRRLFFLACLIGGGTFNLFGSLLGGLVMFVALYLFARSSTANDPQRLRVLLNSAQSRSIYDPLKFQLAGERNR